MTETQEEGLRAISQVATLAPKGERRKLVREMVAGWPTPAVTELLALYNAHSQDAKRIVSEDSGRWLDDVAAILAVEETLRSLASE